MEISMKSVKRKSSSIWLFLTLLVIIFVSSETLYFGTNGNQQTRDFGYMIFFFTVVCWIIRAVVSGKNYSNEKFLVALGFAVLIGMTALTNFDTGNIVKYGYEICLLILAFFITSEFTFNEFAQAFKKIMLFLAAWSLGAFFLMEIAPDFVMSFPAIRNLNNVKYHNVGFAFCAEEMEYVFNRNYGIFREPGVYVVFLSVALIFELFNNDSIKLYKVIIYCVTIATTFSTGGYIVMLCIFFVFLLRKSTIKNNHIKLGIICILLFLLVVIGIDELTGKVFNKLITKDSSYNARVGAIFANIQMILNEPLRIFFGVGFTYAENNFSAAATQVGIPTAHNTNTLLKIFSVHGVFYFLICLYLLYHFVGNFEKKTTGKFLFFIILLLAFSNEDLIVNALIYLLIFYSSAMQQLKKGK